MIANSQGIVSIVANAVRSIRRGETPDLSELRQVDASVLGSEFLETVEQMAVHASALGLEEPDLLKPLRMVLQDRRVPGVLFQDIAAPDKIVTVLLDQWQYLAQPDAPIGRVLRPLIREVVCELIAGIGRSRCMQMAYLAECRRQALVPDRPDLVEDASWLMYENETSYLRKAVDAVASGGEADRLLNELICWPEMASVVESKPDLRSSLLHDFISCPPKAITRATIRCKDFEQIRAAILSVRLEVAKRALGSSNTLPQDCGSLFDGRRIPVHIAFRQLHGVFHALPVSFGYELPIRELCNSGRILLLIEGYDRLSRKAQREASAWISDACDSGDIHVLNFATRFSTFRPLKLLEECQIWNDQVAGKRQVTGIEGPLMLGSVKAVDTYRQFVENWAQEAYTSDSDGLDVALASEIADDEELQWLIERELVVSNGEAVFCSACGECDSRLVELSEEKLPLLIERLISGGVDRWAGVAREYAGQGDAHATRLVALCEERLLGVESPAHRQRELKQLIASVKCDRSVPRMSKLQNEGDMWASLCAGDMIVEHLSPLDELTAKEVALQFELLFRIGTPKSIQAIRDRLRSDLCSKSLNAISRALHGSLICQVMNILDIPRVWNLCCSIIQPTFWVSWCSTVEERHVKPANNCYFAGVDARALARGGVLSHKLFALSLSESPGVDDDVMEEIGEMHRLRSLFLDGAVISDDGASQLGKLTELVVLRLMNGRLTERGLEMIGKLAQLRELSLGGVPMRTGWLRNSASKRSLVYLDLSGATIERGSFQDSSEYQELFSLVLDGCIIEEPFSSLSGFYNLKSLRMGRTTGSGSLVDLVLSLPQLEFVDLSHTALTNDDILDIARSRSLNAILAEDTYATADVRSRARVLRRSLGLPSLMVMV